MRPRVWLGGGVSGWALTLAACAHAPTPPPAPAVAPRFSDSAAFADIRPYVFALLERDLDGDDLADALVVRRVAEGWAAVVFRHQREAQGDSWAAVCQGEAIAGAELDQVRFIELDDGPLLLVTAIDESPDDVVQEVLLLDPSDGCAARLRERLLLVRSEADEVIAPGVVPAGVGGEPGALQLVDRPQFLHLEGSAGGVDLLAGVRRRTVGGSRALVEVSEQRVGFLTPLTVTLSHENGDGPDLAPLTDADDATAVTWPPGAAAQLRLTSDAPLRLLELHWGCAAGEGAALAFALVVGQAPAYPIGGAVPPDGGVLAVGRQHEAGEHTTRALIALREATTALTLALEPGAAPTCLCEVKGYGLR